MSEPRSFHVGATLALGAVAAAIAALPDVRRVAEGVASPGVAWLALAGSTALVLGPMLVLARAARTGASGLRAVLLGAALVAAPLAALGDVLKTHTHHRPLGAATFGVLALVVVLLGILASTRLGAWVERRPSGLRRAVRAVVTGVAVAGLGLVVVRALESSATHHDVIDAIRLLAAAALARMALDQPRVEMWAKRAGMLAWAAIVVAGLLASRGTVHEAIRERAPLLGGPLAWL